jgi:hypothetical protein
MIRVDMENLGYDSINKYAIGDGTSARYTNILPLFSKISFARLHNEIANLQVKVRDGNEAGSKRWDWLHTKLKEMNGVADASN